MKNKVTIEDVACDYDRIYSTQGLRENTKYYKWIVSLLEVRNREGKLLDVACGEGLLLREVKKLYPDITVSGFDISKEACAIAKRNVPEADIFAANGQKIPLDNEMFDIVACLGSLEHYIEPEKGVKEIARVLKNDGVAYIVLPNTFSINTILDIVRDGGKAKQFQIVERSGTKNEWIKFLKTNGLKVEEVHRHNQWPELFCEGTFKIKSIKKFIRKGLIKYFCPLNLARELLFICHKK